MSQYGQTSKNPPWVRSGQNVGQNQGTVAQSLMANALPMTNASLLQYPPVFQNQLSQQLYGAVGAVQYPTRGLNSAAFQTNSSNMSGGHGNQGNMNTNLGGTGSSNSAIPSKAQRVFTGTVTKLQDNFGFVNNDIFFQTSCCVKGSNPQVGDRVLVEAVYNESMPFKWNASRIQVLNNRQEQNTGGRFNSSSNSYKAVPPPSEISGGGSRFSSGGSGGGSRFSNNDRSRARSRSADRNKNRNRASGFKSDSVEDRKRKRDDEKSVDREKERERPRSPPAKKRSKSPAKRPRQSRRPPPRYTVIVPKGRLGSPEFDLIHLTKRYPNLYVPSDFFLGQSKWLSSFPVQAPLSLSFPCNFHVFHKDVDPPRQNDAVLEPPDMDYLYVAKVMLLSSPGLEELLAKTGITSELENSSKDESDDDSVSSSASNVTHVSRLVHFMVGTRGKEPMAIGGPWSPSLDGNNPESDPGVLVKTAIRCCKALTGIDLSSCTQWFRFLEVHYHRAEISHHGKVVPARVETVVIFVPDVWSATPNRVDWEKLNDDYKSALERRLNPKLSSPEPPSSATPDKSAADDKDADTSKDDENLDNSSEKSDLPKKDPTHYSQLDPKSMKVSELRDELEARNLSPKGLKSQLVARLAKAIKTEADEEEANGNVMDDPNAVLDDTVDNKETKESKENRPASPSQSTTSKKSEDKQKEEEKEKEKEKKNEPLSEKDKMHLEKRYRLPENPHILVHPNRSYKGGKFDCTVLSVSSLLGYRIDDSKEHAFEVSLFAEAFNEMLMRDNGFTIYKAILDAPEKPKEEKKEKDDKDKDKKKDKDGKEKEKDKDDEKDDVSSKDKKDDESIADDEDETRKKEDPKSRVVDPNVLLAFSYFDTTRCGYIYDKDLGDLLYCLGLALSRSQVKKLVQKVSIRDTVHYKKLSEKPKLEDGEGKMETDIREEDLVLGNRVLLEMKKTPPAPSPSKKKKATDAANLQSGFVMHNGSLIDVSKLLGQLSKSENSKLDTERELNKLKSDYNKLKETQGKSDRIIKDLQSDIRTYKDKMATTYVDLASAQSNERAYFKAIVDVHHRLAPIIKKKEDEEEARKKKLAEAEVMEIVELTDDDKKDDVKEESAPENAKKTEHKDEK
ncbi:DBC1 [Nesidiocoris tenuis]|uniref:DBC1 n=1 Tax=Nesidiocoris tenuis TaxID=355587 RepID=A0ABN7AVI6_9HEMI|nr:DBC1 [Nesidiocoris tenuis]